MSNIIQETAVELWRSGRRVKQSPSGWLSGNAVCCVHNGETADTRARGGLIITADGAVNWHCFNCKYKTGYSPGRHLSYKFRKLLYWMGADENTVKRLVVEAIRLRDQEHVDLATDSEHNQIKFATRTLPESAKTLYQWAAFYELSDWQQVPAEYHDAVAYADKRGIDLQKYDLYWTPESASNLHRRLIVPFYWQGEVIGFSARAVSDGVKPKYYSQIEPNYVYNLDNQLATSKFVIVCEGTFDAMSIDGVATLGNNCSEFQADIIDSLKREVIVVPDTDRAGKRLVNQAIDYGWTVSFPVWFEKYKDINAAVQDLGKLFVLKSILDGRETTRLKIELRSKKLYN